MTFLDGAFLAGLLAAGIPVIIHLLHRRKAQPIRFPTLRFLEEAHVRTARRTRLTEILILALRTAAIALLALALARPVLHDAAAGSAGVSRVVVVDNSMSMSIRSGPATALERAKLAAIRIVRDLAPADRGAVLPLHHPSSGAFALTESKGRLESILSEITATHRSTPLVERIEDALRLVAGETSPVKQVLVFTDLQASAFGGTTAPLDWPEDVQLLFFRPRAAPVFNAAFGALDVESFGRDRPRVTARIRGLGAGSGSLRIRLLLDGSPSQERSMRLAAGAERSIALDLEGLSSGLHRARLEILGDALAEDDAIDTAVAAGEVLRVLVARDEDLARGTRDPAFYAARALRPRAGARRSIEVDAAFTRSLSERDLSGYHVIFLLEPRSLPRAAGQALAEFVEQGGGLFITASPVGIDPLFAELRLGARPIAPARLEARIDARSSPIHLAELLPEHPLWAPLLNASPPLRPEVPQLTWHRLATAAEDAEVLSSFSTRHPAFISRVEGRGRILLFTASFSDSGSNLPLRFLFAPLVDSIARYLAASRY
ncbi:MAG: BatA domain-containing protein, partial [Planctomycetes bacterium]|nr:BatA domain-containing protein [Planctomycetota bacterium]